MEDSEIVAELQNTFLEEAGQLLDMGEQCLIVLESTGGGSKESINDLFRIFHNLKGSARGVGFNQVSSFTHHLENLLIKVKGGEIKFGPEIADILLQCIDFIKQMLDTLQEDRNAEFDFQSLVERVQKIQDGPTDTAEIAEFSVPESDIREEVSKPEADTYREEEANQGLVLFEPEEQAETPPEEREFSPEPETAALKAVPPSSPPDESHRDEKTPESSKGAEESKKVPVDETIRVRLSKIELLNNYVGEMVIMQSVLNQQRESADPRLLSKSIQQMGKITKEVQEISLELRMAPIKQTFTKMQRISRDTARLVGKKVNLILKGEETEVDKTVLEKLNDPLVHIIRNAIDHGLESPEDRIKLGKPEIGRVELDCYHDGGRVLIEVRDDGRGMDPEIIRKKAVEKGVISPESTFSDEKHMLNLIFHPGFSTKDVASEVSGRGVGMDVVQTNIRELSGDIAIESIVNAGSCFKISLPLSLSVINGMIAAVNDRKYVLPITQVSESIKIRPEDLERNEGIGLVFHLRGQNIPVAFAHEILKEKIHKRAFYTAVIVRKDNIESFAVLVDEILSQQQIVVKPLSKALGFTFGLMGSSILGDGLPAFILDLFSMGSYIQNQRTSSTIGELAYG